MSVKTIDLGKIRYVHCGNWALTSTYTINSTVVYDGELWLLSGAEISRGDIPSMTDGPWIKIGLRGPTGDTGAAATVRIGSVTATETGTTPTVSNSGTEYNAVLDFTLPKGVKGDKGDKGDKGATGARGLQGVQGEKGEQGVRGEEGPQGKEGPQGVQGLQGPRGPEGPQGPQGEKGADGLSFGSFYISSNSDLVLVCFTDTQADNVRINDKGELTMDI